MSTPKTIASTAIALSLGCATSHTLEPPASLPQPGAACTIGVARFGDDTGLDFGVDLRDYLRAHGPCRSVILVSGDEGDAADFVVSGSARAKLTRDPIPAGESMGAIFTGIGGGLLLAGGIFAAVGKEPDPKEPNYSDLKSSYDAMSTVKNVALVSGAVFAGAGILSLIIDSSSVREMKMIGTIEADLEIRRAGSSVARWTVKDEVVSRGQHPAGRPESRESVEAGGLLYPEFFGRIFENVATKLDEVVRQNPQGRAGDVGAGLQGVAGLH